MTFEEANESYFHRIDTIKEAAKKAFNLGFFTPICWTCDHRTKCYAYTDSKRDIKVCNFYRHME